MRVRVVGNLGLLPADVRALIAEAVTVTRDHDKAFLNVAFAYTGEFSVKVTSGENAEGVFCLSG